MKCGFVTIIGRPNVGKSTLLNQILGQKIVITTDKAQTTRKRIKGILTDKEGQIIFVSDGAVYADIDASTRVNMGTSIIASELSDGLMSSDDKIKLDFLTYNESTDTVTFA